MNNNKTVILAAVGAMLVGGVSTAALMKSHKMDTASVDTTAATAAASSQPAPAPAPAATGKGLEYAQVLGVTPVTQKTEIYGTITSIDPIRERSSSVSTRESCHDVAVREVVPEAQRSNVGGTVAGALLGGLAGSRFGGGHGRNAAALAGAVAGGFIGNHISNERHQEDVQYRTVRRCSTVDVPVQSSYVRGYTVNYRKDDGSIGSVQMSNKPTDSRVDLGQADQTVGYTVSYLYGGRQQTIQLPQPPASNQLTLIDGQVVTQIANAAPQAAGVVNNPVNTLR